VAGSTPGIVGTATSVPIPVPESTPARHYVVMVVIDAGQAANVDLQKLPHIHALMQNGVTYDRAFVGQLESSTPGVHVTLGTGTLPKENGFLGFGWAAPDTRQHVDFRTLLANRMIDPVLKALAVPSVATRLHQFIPNAVSVAASGHKDYATVGLGGGTADYELFGKTEAKTFVPTFMHAPPPLTAAEKRALIIPSPIPAGGEDTWAFRYAAAVASHVKPRLLMINIPEMDTYGHWDGPADRSVMSGLMRGIDAGIGTLEDTYRRLGILQRTDFIVTADHAMMESRPARNFGLVKVAAAAAGATVARADGAGGGIWLQNPTQAKSVAEHLVALHPLHVMAVFYRSAPGNDYSYMQASPMSWLANRNVGTALQHLVDTTAGQDGPDLWVLYRENYTTLATNTTGTWKGTHGGATWKVQHIPLVMSGPGIRRGVHSSFPSREIDIAPTLERLLGLPPIHRDGVILADALTDPMSYELKPQRAVTPGLVADVLALQAQSKWDNSFDRPWPALPPKPSHCTLTPNPATHVATCKPASAPPTNG
jgi:arylsulfatase A-like enzyme